MASPPRGKTTLARELAHRMPALAQELLARGQTLATRYGVDAEAVWEWGFIERVSTGLTNLRELHDGEGSAFLEVAARCL